MNSRADAELGTPSPAAVHETLKFFWDSPFPASLQGGDFRLIDVNDAFVAFTGYPRETLIGMDPLAIQPEEDRAHTIEGRHRVLNLKATYSGRSLTEGRIVDASGHVRWYRIARHALADAQGAPLYMAVMQDTTSEHAARERADRSVRELDDWFDLSPVGMVLFDDTGLLIRSNPAFDEMVGTVPISLGDSAPSLARLLSWGEGGALEQLHPSAPAIETQGWLTQPDGRVRRLRAIVRCYRTARDGRRFMGIVEDRSAEEERDLATMQIGALVDNAGVGIATFEASSGWVQRSPSSGKSASAATLQNIGRDMVATESLDEFERLQEALSETRRAEARYAIHHPELGLRWLLSRVEPATLASGKKTASVVTLDITDQQLSQRRSEQLLREMTTILESTTAGIAFLRSGALVRCNRRFESMLRLPASGLVGSSLAELLSRHANAASMAGEIRDALATDATYEIEFAFDDRSEGDAASDGSIRDPRWYSLSVRNAGASRSEEAIAVLTDVTRMKMQQVELETLARDRELMFSLSEVGIAFMRDGRIHRANSALSNLTGWPVAALPALDLGELFVESDDAQRRREQEEREMSLYGRWSGERQLRRRDGRLIWVQMAKRLIDQQDASLGLIASYVNVDARHRAEQAVALQAERTRSILDSVLVGIVTVGPSGIEWMNRAARRMFGGNLADFLNQPISTLATADADHLFRQPQYLDDLVDGRSETFECRLHARDGREFWVVGNAVATGREVTGRQLTFALLDIERRRQAEAAVSEAQASLRRVIDAAPLAIALLDASTFAVVQANEVAAGTVRGDAQSLIGKTPEQMFSPPMAAERRADMHAALASSEVTVREYRFELDGEPRVWDARYMPLTTGKDAPDQLLVVATDVTEQRAAQEARLEAAIAQREMLVKEVHHRIKNNLQGVAGLLQQIASRKPEVAGAIEEVVAQVQAIAQVYGLQVGANGPISMVDLLRAIAASVSRTFGRPVRCDVLGDDLDGWTLPEAEAIPIALTINELITNAIKHGPAAPDAAAVVCALKGSSAIGVAGGDGLGGGDGIGDGDGDDLHVAVSSRASLPPGFNLARVPNGVSGLGLVRALLPRRGARLRIEQQGADVVATIALRRPVVTRADA